MKIELRFLLIVIFLKLLIFLAACEKLWPVTPAEDSILDGPVEGLNSEESLQFLRGDIAFNDEIFTPETGLGPLFVATSCGSCHAGDGKGHPFSMLTRFGQNDSTGNKFLELGGPQLQNRSITHYNPEIIPPGASFSKFMPPANTGLGLLDAVSDADLLLSADPNDADGDGISGRPNWINIPAYTVERPGSVINQDRYIGRFGKKAAAYDLLHQTVNAYSQDIGIASSFEPYDTYSGLPIDPEISNQTIHDVVFYLKTLKAPLQRQIADTKIQTGKNIFTLIGCAKCHQPELKTSTSPIVSLSNKTFAPYTDLLLHDMGPGLDDGYTEGSAGTAEWRTPPLWGLGLSKNSQGGQYFLLHDGRARSIDEAIVLHGGEAAQSRSNYQQLRSDDKLKLIAFLESL